MVEGRSRLELRPGLWDGQVDLEGLPPVHLFYQDEEGDAPDYVQLPSARRPIR